MVWIFGGEWTETVTAPEVLEPNALFGGWYLPDGKLKEEFAKAQAILNVQKNRRYRRIAAAAGAELLLPKAEYERRTAAGTK